MLATFNSCSENELDIYPPTSDDIADIDTEEKLQQFLNSGYLTIASTSSYGTDITAFGDILSDNMYVLTNKYQFAANLSYNSINNDFGFYGRLYDIIMSCNMVINNTKVPSSANVERIKAEAKILRGFAYFTLVNFYSPTPTSGINQEFGVPLVLENYNSTIQPARASVTEVFNQIISDLQAGAIGAADIGASQNDKVILTKTAAKLLLSRVYLTRRASGDAQLALQYASDIVNSPAAGFSPIASSGYQTYFAGNLEATSENQPETIWELDITFDTSRLTGIGSNLSLPGLYHRTDGGRSFMFTRDFYNSFSNTDVRRGNGANALLTTTGGTPTGVWTNKYPRLTESGLYLRNIKVLRFAEAQLNRIEALNLTGQTATALTELNAFATSRGGSAYSGTNLLNDILTERSKEFYAEGYRFHDLKRYSLPLVKNTNCTMNCNVPANDKLFVIPVSRTALSQNVNLTQYPGYN